MGVILWNINSLKLKIHICLVDNLLALDKLVRIATWNVYKQSELIRQLWLIAITDSLTGPNLIVFYDFYD